MEIEIEIFKDGTTREITTTIGTNLRECITVTCAITTITRPGKLHVISRNEAQRPADLVSVTFLLTPC